jgi:rsbT co-antagonist protein RsbR
MSDEVKQAHKLVEEAKRIAGFPALLHRFLDTAAEAIVIVNSSGRIVFFNRRATFLFGWSAEEIIGQTIETLLPDDLKVRHVEHREGFMSEPYTRAMGANLDLQGKHKDGTTFPVLIDLHPEMGTDGTYVRAAIRRNTEGVKKTTTPMQKSCPYAANSASVTPDSNRDPS